MPCLIDDVECFWLERVVGNQQVIPQGVFDIFINTHMRYYGTDKQRFQPSMWLVGQHTCQYQLTAQALCWVFSIRLQPFALLPFPQFNALEIKNTLQNIADNFGGHTLANQVINILSENKVQTAKTLLAVCSELAQIWLVNNVLSKVNFTVPTLFRAETNYILGHKGDIQVNALCDSFCLSKVTIRKHFLVHCGLLSKELSQIWRLNHFLMLAHSGKLPSMTDAAIAAGFYDQAHLIREFKGILNCTPTVYFKENGFDSATITQINKRFAGVYNPIEQKD
ncbi:hypothetical protein BET10_15330 [Pseudoalteromonas amylolytica]|uniref:HTH araC/xylS-type domain-containing protein n=2 Tax=Pseudoalteromonas TaxID=53246 RepID=A0A1S1MSN6_9GAMM|nr:hypothetical protein BFC16_19645 [Pseudoalteromonas sp. JW3]OHU90143.1 hypothetical protein BET10_15330 [Pseudoalteromonas amylolytica]